MSAFRGLVSTRSLWTVPPALVPPQLTTLAYWGGLSGLLAALRTRHELPSRSAAGPNGSLQCSRTARPKPPIPRPSPPGGRPLEQEQLQPIIDKLLDRLVSKNVAENIGQQVCESVCSSLLGKQVSSFASLSTTVKASMEGALTRILTPTRRVDLLADVQRARDEKRSRAVLTYMWCGLRVPAFAYPPLRAQGAGPLVLKAQGPCARAAGPDAPCVPCVPVYLGTTGRT